MNKNGRKSGTDRTVRKLNPEAPDSYTPDFLEDDDLIEFDVDEADIELARERGREKAEQMERAEKAAELNAGKKKTQGRTVRKLNLDDAEKKTAAGKTPADRKAQAAPRKQVSAKKQAVPKKTVSRKTASQGSRIPSVSSPDSGDTVLIGLINKRETNKEIRRAAYAMLLLLFLVIAYFVYFDAALGRGVVNNVHNSRLSKIAESVSRGEILSADGEVLAYTDTDDEGNSVRVYPYGRTFAHVIGTSQVNKSGVELSEDYDLVTSMINPMEKVINDLKGEKDPGNRVTTTLNAQLQETAWYALGDRYGVAIAIEPSTGKILAMVSLPDYDPNTLPDNYEDILADKESKVLLNQALQGQFVPGSIFKVITTLSYLRSGHSPDDFYYVCDGYTTLLDDDGEYSTLSCSDYEVHGEVNLEKAFADSCNSAYVNIGAAAGPAKLRETADSMLFNKVLPTDLPTVKSSFSLPDTSSEWKIGATSIGQGDTVMTPLHAAMIASAVANDGELMKPYLVDRVESADGNEIRKNEPQSAGELMSSSEASLLQDMMEAVVNEGTADSLSGRYYTAAGKTGTAEVAGRGNNAWFIGYAPADDPKIAVCVLVEDAGKASSDAVPVAAAIMDAYMYSLEE